LTSAWLGAAALDWTGSLWIAMALALVGMLLLLTLLTLLQMAIASHLQRRGALEPGDSVWDPLPRRQDALVLAVIAPPALAAPVVYYASNSIAASFVVLIGLALFLRMLLGGYLRYMNAPPEAEEL
jgi:hypothetical protein